MWIETLIVWLHTMIVWKSFFFIIAPQHVNRYDIIKEHFRVDRTCEGLKILPNGPLGCSWVIFLKTLLQLTGIEWCSLEVLNNYIMLYQHLPIEWFVLKLKFIASTFKSRENNGTMNLTDECQYTSLFECKFTEIFCRQWAKHKNNSKQVRHET